MGAQLHRLQFLADFITDIHRNNRVLIAMPSEWGLWFSRHDEGSVFLSKQETFNYNQAVSKFLELYSKGEELSRRAAELLIQKAIFDSLDLPSQKKEPFNDRLQAALREIARKLDQPPKTYTCYVPVLGLAKDGLPARVGSVRFILLNEYRVRQFYPNPPRGLRTHLRESSGKTAALLQVRARDEEAARFLAERECRGTVDIVNFFSDLIKYNYGWLYLPGEADAIPAEAWLATPTEHPHVTSSRRGPLMEFSFKKLRREQWLKRRLRRVQELFHNKTQSDLAEVILTSMQWAGRATVEPKREQSFLLYAIALETVVLPIQVEELGYRLRTRTARLIQRNPRKRLEIQNDLRDLYKVRSKIVHSGSYQVTDQDLGRLRVIVKSAILDLMLDRTVRKLRTRKELDEWFETRALR